MGKTAMTAAKLFSCRPEAGGSASRSRTKVRAAQRWPHIERWVRCRELRLAEQWHAEKLNSNGETFLPPRAVSVARRVHENCFKPRRPAATGEFVQLTPDPVARLVARQSKA